MPCAVIPLNLCPACKIGRRRIDECRSGQGVLILGMAPKRPAPVKRSHKSARKIWGGTEGTPFRTHFQDFIGSRNRDGGPERFALLIALMKRLSQVSQVSPPVFCRHFLGTLDCCQWPVSKRHLPLGWLGTRPPESAFFGPTLGAAQGVVSLGPPELHHCLGNLAPKAVQPDGVGSSDA